MDHTCEIQESPAQPALSIRTRTPAGELPQTLGRIFPAIAGYLAELGQQPAGPTFVAYYNMDMQDLEIEAGFPVATSLPGRDEIQASQIPGGKRASTLHVGPYSECGPAYQALSEWLRFNDHEPTGVAYEMYLNDPQTTPPQELQTRIVFPLK